MQRILIIEDEQLNAVRLERLLLDIDNTLKIEGPLTTVDSVTETLGADNDFDLILSDIRLKERLVFEAFQEVMPRCPVIFVTAYDEYALKAFRNNGIDYLLKPIDADELAAAYHKAEQMSATEQMTHKLQATSKELKCYRERIVVIRNDELISVKVADISYIHMEDNLVVAHTFGGDLYHLSQNMSELEDLLSPDIFFRLNRQYIAHIDSIQKIRFSLNNKLSVRVKDCTDDSITVSKEKSSKFRNWLEH